MSPRIEIVGDIEKAAPYIPWAKQQWSMQEGYWYKHVDNLLIEFNRSGSDGVIRIVAEGPQLVTTPRKITTMTPPVYSADSKVAKVYGVDFDCTEELSGSPEEFEQFYGNYHVVDSECEQIYSIYAPPHDLAGDIQENIQGYTRYAWTTNVSMEDVYTCYSEYVYQGGEPVIAGTMAPPEAAFKYGLIVGIGFNDKNELQLAQLVQIPRYYGYWKTDQGLKFGTNLPGTLVWRNEDPDKKWFVEFFTGNGLDAEYSDIKIYDRKDASRGSNQWFYNEGKWSQYSRSVPSTYSFKGITADGSLDKTEYTLAPKEPTLDKKVITLTHSATSSAGVNGSSTEIMLPVKVLPDNTININYDPTWPAVGTKAHITGYGNCNVIQATLNNLPTFSLITLEDGHSYDVLRKDLGTTCNAHKVDGSIVVTNGRVTQTQPIYIAGTTPSELSIGCYLNCSYLYSYSQFYASGGTAPYTWSAQNINFTVDNAQGTSIKVTGATDPPPDSTITGTLTLTDACGKTTTMTLTIQGTWTQDDVWSIGDDMPCASSMVGGQLFSTTVEGNIKTEVYTYAFRANQEGTLIAWGCCGSMSDNPGPWNLRYTYGSVSCDLKPWLLQEVLIDSGWVYCQGCVCSTCVKVMQGFGWIKSQEIRHRWHAVANP